MARSRSQSASQHDGDLDESGRWSPEASDDDDDAPLIYATHSAPLILSSSSSLPVVTFGPSDETLLSRIRRYHHQQKERPLVAGNASGLGMASPTRGGGGASQISMLGRGAATAFDIASREITQVLPFPSFVYVERRMMLRSPFSCAEFQHQLLRQALHQAHRERVQRRQNKVNLAQKPQQQQQRSSTHGKKANPTPPSTSRRRGTSLNLHPRKSSEARTAVSAHISRIRRMQLMHTVLAYDEECRRVRNFADRFDEWSGDDIHDDDSDANGIASTDDNEKETGHSETKLPNTATTTNTVHNTAIGTVGRAASFNQSHTSNSTQGTPKTGIQSSPPIIHSPQNHHRQQGSKPTTTTTTAPPPQQLPSPESIMLNVVKLPSLPVVAGQPVIVAYDHRYKVDIPITVRVPTPAAPQPTTEQVQRTPSSETAEGGEGGSDNDIRTPPNGASDSDNSSNGGDASDNYTSMLGQRPTAIPPPPPTTTTTTTTRYITRTIVERRLYRGVFLSAVAGQTVVLGKVSIIVVPPEDTQKPGTTSSTNNNTTPQRLRTQTLNNNSRRGSLVGFHSDDVDATSSSSSHSGDDEDSVRSSSAAPRRRSTITWDPKIEEEEDVDASTSQPPPPSRCALCGRMSCASPASSTASPHLNDQDDQPSIKRPSSLNPSASPQGEGVGKQQVRLGCAFLDQLLAMIPRGLPTDVEKSHLAQKWKDGEVLKFVGPFVTLNMDNVIEVIPADRSPEDRAYALAQTTHGNEANARTREVALWNAATILVDGDNNNNDNNNIMHRPIAPAPIFKGLREIRGILCQLAQRCLMESLRKATCTLVCTLPTSTTTTTTNLASASSSAAASSSSPKGTITFGTRHGCFCTQESSPSPSTSMGRTIENTLVIWEEQQRVQRSYYRGLVSILSPLYWNTQTRAYDEYRQRRRGESLRKRVANTDSIQSILASAAARKRSGTSKRRLVSASDSFNSPAAVSKSLSQQQLQQDATSSSLTNTSINNTLLRPSSQEMAKRSRRKTRVSGVEDDNPESALPLFELRNGGSWLAGRPSSINRESSSTLSQEPPGYLQAAVVESEFISAIIDDDDHNNNNSDDDDTSLIPQERGGEKHHASQPHRTINGCSGGVAAGMLEEDENGPPISASSSPPHPGVEVDVMAHTLVGSSSSIDDMRSDTDTRAPPGGNDAGSIPSGSFEIRIANSDATKQHQHIPHQQKKNNNNRRRSQNHSSQHFFSSTSFFAGKKYPKDHQFSKKPKKVHSMIMSFKPSKSSYMSAFVPVLWRLLNQRKHQLLKQQQGGGENSSKAWDFETSSRASSIHRVENENMDVAASFGSWITDLLHVSLALEKHDTSPSIALPAVAAVLTNKGCLSREGGSSHGKQAPSQNNYATLTPTAAASGGSQILPIFGRSGSSLVGTPPQGITTHNNTAPQQHQQQQHTTANTASSIMNVNTSSSSPANLEQLFKDLQVETQERRDGQALLHWATTVTYVGDCITCGGGRGLLPCQCTACCQAHLDVIPQLLQANDKAATASSAAPPMFTNTGTGMFLISTELASSCMKIASEQNKITAAAQHQTATINLHVPDLPPPLTRVATTHFSDEDDMSKSGEALLIHTTLASPSATSKQQQQEGGAYLTDDQLCRLALLVAASRDGITAPHHPSAIHTLYLLQSLTKAATHQKNTTTATTTNNSNNGATFTVPAATTATSAAAESSSISQIRHLLFEGERNAAKAISIIINNNNRHPTSGGVSGGGGNEIYDSEYQTSNTSTPRTSHLHGGGKSSIVAIRIPRTPQQDGLRTTSFQSVGFGMATPREEDEGVGEHLPSAPSLGASFALHGGGGGGFGGAASSISPSNFGTPSLAFASIPNASFASISLPQNSPALHHCTTQGLLLHTTTIPPLTLDSSSTMALSHPRRPPHYLQQTIHFSIPPLSRITWPETPSI